MDIKTATTSDIHHHLVAVRDRLLELAAEDRLTLERDAEPIIGTARRAVEQINQHLDDARHVLAWLETRD